KIDAKGTTSAQLYEQTDGELKPIAAGERKQFGESMTKTIETLIGLDFQKLKVASLVQQGELQSIINADPKKFKELVNAIIGIDRLDVAYELMKKSIDVFRESVKKRLEYDDTSIEILKTRSENIKKEIDIIEPQRKKMEAGKKNQEEEFIVLQQKIEFQSPKEVKMTELESRKNELSGYLKNAISSLKNEISEKEKKLEECTSCLQIVSSKSETENQIKSLEQEIEKTRLHIRDASEKIGKLNGQQEIAEKLRLVDGKCPVCDSKVDHLSPLFEEQHVRTELENLQKSMDLWNKSEKTTSDSIKTLDSKLRQIIKAENTLNLNKVKDENDLLKLKEEIFSLRTNIENVPHEITASGNLLQFAIDDHSSSLIKTISSLQEETQNFDRVEFKELKTTLEQKRRSLSILDQELGAINQKIKSFREEEQKIANTLEELQIVRQYVTQLETIRNQIYNRDGPVASSLRSWALNMISQKASEYLVTFNVKIQRVVLEDKARDIGITCYAGNTHLDLESLSGGEKVSLALALRFGMAHLMGSSNLGFIILDEPTTHLDQERRKSLVNVLTQAFEANLDTISQFVIITHDSEIFENSNVDTIYSFESGHDGTKVTSI
ncbi:MAG TPA: SMC family ATPase, partial [Candidatus Bathyarchaeia archaeon]|nr:SMC family ATPase [Candidatus Bathyarchaeia archaeon]